MGLFVVLNYLSPFHALFAFNDTLDSVLILY
jgi:hypothetical protein